MASGDGDGDGLPDKEKLTQAVENAQAAQKAQSAADVLKSKAGDLKDPAKREQLLHEAFEKEMEANGHSKMAKRLQSGTWQGMGFGGGIGAATGVGLGAGVGTLLGGLTSVPLAGLGMLAGSATGAIHGPWIKLGGKEQKFEDADPGEVVDALEKERGKQGLGQGGSGQQPAEQGPTSGGGADSKPRRKPKKLEVRSQRKQGGGEGEGGGATAENVPAKNGSTADQKPRKKPKKLEVRSKKSGGDAGS